MSLYEQIKELSEKATPGPWKDIDHDPGEVIVYGKDNSRVAKVPKFTGIGLINAELIVTLVNNLPSVLSALKGQEPIVWHGLDEDPGQVWVFAWGPDVCIGLEYDRNPQELAHDGYTKWCLAEGRIPTPPEGVSL